MEKGKISPRQAAQLTFITMVATAILFVPNFSVSWAGRDAWIASILGALFGLVTLALVVWLGNKHRGQTIFSYAETILGKWLGKLVAFGYIWLFVKIAAISAREFGDFMSTAFMPNTPISVFIFSLIFLAAWAALAGLEIIARMNEFVIILVVTFLLGILLLSTPNWEPVNLLPVLNAGIRPILETVIMAEVWKSETIVLAILLPFLTRPKRAFLYGTAATLGAGALMTIGIAGVLAVFGPELVVNIRFPIHHFTRTIAITQILTRFEVIVMITWVAGVFIKTSFFYYLAALGTAQLFGISQYRPLVLPLGVFIAALSITLFENVVELEEKLGAPSVELLIRLLVIPVLLILVTVTREKLFGAEFGRKKSDE